MDANATIDVVRIPYDGLPMEIVTVPLMHAAEYITTSCHAVYSEKHLTYVPRLSGYIDWRIHASKLRELVNLGNLDPEQSRRERFEEAGPYFMYRFSSRACKALDRKRNEHFRNAKGAESVYGDAFIFKVKRPASQDEDRVVEYENLDKSFIDFVFKGKKGKFPSASECLRWMSKL